MIRLFILCLLLLSSCSPLVWTKPGATEADLQRDLKKCSKYGFLTPDQIDFVPYAAIDTSDIDTRATRNCMKAYGWHQERTSVALPPGRTYQDFSRDLERCDLEARGNVKSDFPLLLQIVRDLCMDRMGWSKTEIDSFLEDLLQ